MKVFAVKELKDSIWSISGNQIKPFRKFTIVELGDEDGEFLIQLGLACKTVQQE